MGFCYLRAMIMTKIKQAFGKCSRGEGAADEDRPGRKCWLWNPGESPQSKTPTSSSPFFLKLKSFFGRSSPINDLTSPSSFLLHTIDYYRTCTLRRCFWKPSSGSFPIPFSLIRFFFFSFFNTVVNIFGNIWSKNFPPALRQHPSLHRPSQREQTELLPGNIHIYDDIYIYCQAM